MLCGSSEGYLGQEKGSTKPSWSSRPLHTPSPPQAPPALGLDCFIPVGMSQMPGLVEK